MRWQGYCVLLLLAVCGARSARILALFPGNAKSHFFMFATLLRDLTMRGHDVTLLSHFSLGVQYNYTFLDVSETMADISDSVSIEWLDSLTWTDKITFPWYENEEVCDILDHHHSQNLLQSTEKYDLIITEIFGTDCFLGFVQKFQAPFIGMTSSVLLPWSNDRLGNPDHPAYIPSYYLPYTDHMTTWQRLVNTILTIGVKIAYRVVSDKPSYEVAKKHFGEDLAPLSEIARNTSLIFVNSHFSVNQVRPLVPNVIEVGGLHIPEPKPLPKHLEDFMNASEDGVIFFSLGSLFNSATLPVKTLTALLSAFAQLPQKVLWKMDTLPGIQLPDNVRTEKWLPQFDVLSHPKTVLFITHGGLMGTQEAVHAGVPLLGIPLFADQHLNIRKYVTEGLAVKLEYEDISMETVLDSIKTVLNNDEYTQNSKQVSRLFRDRVQTSRETAVFWTEYVIRHKGARHLRVRGADLSLSQYLLLDVQEVLIGAAIVFIISCYTLVKYIAKLCRSCFRRTLPGDDKKNS